MNKGKWIVISNKINNEWKYIVGRQIDVNMPLSRTNVEYKGTYTDSLNYCEYLADKLNHRKTAVYKNPFSMETEEVFVDVLTYKDEPMCMALQIYSLNDEPIATLTVNLGNHIGNDSFMQFCCAFLDINNFETAESFVEFNNLAEKYIRFGSPVTKQSGFVEYPLYQFSPEQLQQFDSEGFEEYTNLYKAGLGFLHENYIDSEMEPEEILDDDEYEL